MFPHEILAIMYANHYGEFKKYCLGSEPLSEFWSHIPEDDPRLRNHPIRKIEGFKEKCVPLRLHGDAVPIGKKRGRSLDTMSLSSVIGARVGSTWDWKWPFFAMVDGAKWKRNKKKAEVTDTMSEVWVIIEWMFLVLLSGVWPARNWKREPFEGWRGEKAGEPLAGGLLFVLFQIAADLDYFCNYLQLQHFNSAVNPCFRCYGNRTDIPISDLRESARWRQHLVDLVAWFLTEKHRLFSNPRLGVNLFHVMLDILHMMDLGEDQPIGASVLYLFVFDTGLAGTFENKATVVFQNLVKAYNVLGTPAGERFSESLFSRMFERCGRTGRPKEYPRLFCKGAVARHAIPALRLMARDLIDWAPDSMLSSEDIWVFGHVLALLTNLSNFYDCLFLHGLWLPDAAAEEARQYLLEVGLHHQTLTTHFMMKGRQLFHLTEKAHYVQHLGDDCRNFKMNPRYGWCYGDEDLMGRIAQMARACTKGRGPIRLGVALFQRWRNRMYITWKKRSLRGG